MITIEFPERALRERIAQKLDSWLQRNLHQGQTLRGVFAELAGGPAPWDLVVTTENEIRVVQSSAWRPGQWLTILPKKTERMVVGELKLSDDEEVVIRRRRALADDLAREVVYWCPIGHLGYLRRFAFTE